MPPTRIGARDSMPGAAIPSAARLSISAAPGRRSAASRARARTAWVEEELAAGNGPQAVGGLAEGSLVGDGEGADIVDFVAPQLHAQGVGFLGREDVEDAAAHAHLAAAFDHVDALVAELGQAIRGLGEVQDVAGAHAHGFEVGQAGDDRLEEGADRHDEDRHRARALVPAMGWTRRRRTAMRRAIVSTWGERRSWGRVSHAGSMATPGIHEARALVSDLGVAPGGREDDEGRGRARGDGREEGRPDADGGDDRARTADLDGVGGRLDRGIGGDVREESGE